jgi:hypothetical protein
MKKYIILVLIALLIGVLLVGCTTVTPEIDLSKKPGGPAGNSNIAHLYLYEKDSIWDIVPDGAWGKMKYNQSGETFDFVFNGHGLVHETEYTLIYYPDPWPGTGLICLGSGTVNEEGNIHIAESVNTGDLPACGDRNVGAKIWLVLSDDVDCDNKMTGWNPEEYLFENNLIEFEDIDTDWLCLYEKLNDASCDWPVVDGAWGKMKYNLLGDEFEFVFNGHGLDTGVDYTLIYYPDPWPGNGLICLGSGIANIGGEVNIAGSKDTGDLPTEADDNADPLETTYCFGETGAKIWLIPTSDVNCVSQTMVAWNHATDIYLFEGELITFEDTDD